MPDSTVQFINIDEEFPIAGQDNDSQGFRDNFSEIKQALENTNLELTDLLTNSARLDNTNNFNGNEISNAVMLGVAHEVGRKTISTAGNNSEANTISWDQGGDYHVLTVTGASTITLSGWSDTDTVSKMRIVLATNGGTHDVTFSTTGSVRVGPTWPTQTKTITVDSSTAPIIVDAWTSDGGTIVYLDYIGKFTPVV